ncbi:hypothetical protein BDQ17DRAFT_1360756 [Cyathus striatus]|nr:hypothetical protein BDQ17DRAFT_1360756 [Cyathus striatus]
MASDSDNASPPSGEESAPTSRGHFTRNPVLLCASTSDSTCGSVYTTDCVQDISVKVSPSISLSYSCSTCTVESLDLSRVNEFSSAPRAASPPATAAAAACPESPGISLYESPSTSSSNTSNIDKLAAPLPPSSFNHPVRELSNADENGLGSTNTLDSCGAVINESDHLVPKTFHYIPSGCKAGSSSDLSTTPLNLSSRCPSPLPVSPLPVRAVIVRTPVITGPTPEISKIAYDIPLSAPLPISLPPLPPPPLPPLPIHTIIARHPVITHHDSYLLPEAAKIEILPATSPFFPSGPVRSPTPPAFSALAYEDTKAGEDTSLPLYSPMPFVHRSPSALSLSFSVYNDQESEDQRHSVHCSPSEKENTPLLPQSHYQPTPSIRRSPSTVSLCSTKSFRSGLSSLATLPNPHSPRCNRRYRLRVVEPAYYPPWNLYTIYEDREIHH